MIEMRRYLDWQDMMIAHLCSVSSATGTWKFPIYPPTDATRADDALFKMWLKEMEWRRDMMYDAEHHKEDIERLYIDWVAQDGRTLDEMHRSEQNRAAQCWRYWDGELQRDIAFDHEGHLAQRRSAQTPHR